VKFRLQIGYSRAGTKAFLALMDDTRMIGDRKRERRRERIEVEARLGK
jgi:hypothetical protein